MPLDERRHDLLAVAAIVIIITIVFADVLFGGSCFSVRDLIAYSFPTKSLLHRIVASGDFPSWNPYYSGGQPAAANPEYAVFYPGQWPIFLPDFYLGFRLHIVMHFYIAALAMYALMRSLRARPAASLATAFAFVFGGVYLSLTNLLATLFPLSWLPLTLACIIRRRYALAAIVLGVQCLTFEPATFLNTCALIAAIALWRRDWRPLAVIPAGLAAGAAQVLPMLDLLRHTNRAHGLPFDRVAYWSMPPQRLLEMLQPHFLGSNPFLGGDWWGGELYRQAILPFIQNLYLGFAILVAVIAGLVLRDRRTLAATALACASWLVALGEHTPLLRLAYTSGLPLAVRFPERFAVLGAVALLVGGGLMLDRICEPRVRDIALRVAAALAVVYVIGALLSSHRMDWLWMLARAAAFAVVLLVPRRTGIAIAAFTLVELLPFMPELAPRSPREFFEPPPVLRTMPPSAWSTRIFFQPEWSNGPISQRYFSDQRRVYTIARNGLFPRVPAAWGLRTIFERDYDHTNLAVTEELTAAMWQTRSRAVLAMANAGVQAAFRPYPSDPPTVFVPVPTLPRYYFADAIASPAEFPHRSSPRTAYAAIPPFPPAPATIARVDERSNRVTLDVEAPAPAFLIASNTFDEHWRATIEGVRAPLVRTNIAFQGVVVPPGRHRIELRYVNPYVQGGAALSAVMFLGLAIAAYAQRQSRPTSTNPAQ